MLLRSLICIGLVFLSSCTLPGTSSESGSTSSNESSSTTVFSGSGFSINVPKTWSGAASSEIPTPAHGEVVLAYRSPDVKYGFANTMIVMRDTLNGLITSQKYSDLNNIQSSKNYLQYTQISNDVLLFADDDASSVYVFEAKYNANTPLMQFIQTAKVCGTEVYLIDITLSLDKNPSTYIPLLKSFACGK